MDVADALLDHGIRKGRRYSILSGRTGGGFQDKDTTLKWERERTLAKQCQRVGEND